MERRFARLATPGTGRGHGTVGLPSDGMCLNVFLVLTAPADDGQVLMGRISPGPTWAELGGVDPARAERIGERWMLPASQLLLFESPTDAATRLAKELLGIDRPLLEGPQVFSEAYARSTDPSADPHWDLHFVFTGRGPARAPTHPLWKELAYLPVAKRTPSEFARSHGDILELVGFHLRTPPTAA